MPTSTPCVPKQSRTRQGKKPRGKAVLSRAPFCHPIPLANKRTGPRAPSSTRARRSRLLIAARPRQSSARCCCCCWAHAHARQEELSRQPFMPPQPALSAAPQQLPPPCSPQGAAPSACVPPPHAASRLTLAPSLLPPSLLLRGELGGHRVQRRAVLEPVDLHTGPRVVVTRKLRVL